MRELVYKGFAYRVERTGKGWQWFSDGVSIKPHYFIVSQNRVVHNEGYRTKTNAIKAFQSYIDEFGSFLGKD